MFHERAPNEIIENIIRYNVIAPRILPDARRVINGLHRQTRSALIHLYWIYFKNQRILNKLHRVQEFRKKCGPGQSPHAKHCK